MIPLRITESQSFQQEEWSWSHGNKASALAIWKQAQSPCAIPNRKHQRYRTWDYHLCNSVSVELMQFNQPKGYKKKRNDEQRGITDIQWIPATNSIRNQST